jgi:hypothetical protein
MKKSLLCVVLLVAVPALATISQVQSAATWKSSGTTCSVSLPGTAHNNLIALWVTWSPSSLTLSLPYVDPKNNTFVTAVGPTIQSASGTAAQIVYAKAINPGTDNIAIQFANSGSATSVSCVAVEYSGLDTFNPLDSAHAGFSYSPSGTLDSGAAAPANASLLLFGGGTGDGGSLIAGGSFTAIQASGGSITEQEVVSSNNTLQRATAILNPSNGPGATGNWLMQMAVFRDASVGPVVAGPPLRSL